MRVCLDTNVLVAAFATRGLCADVFRAVVAEHELVIGEVILTELHRVMKIKLRLPDDRVAAVEAMLAGFEVTPKPEHPSSIEVRDPSDQWVLATAVVGGADVLVTGDQDLLTVQRQAPIPIVDPRAFWELLRAGHTG